MAQSQRTQDKCEAILNAIPNGLIVLDAEWRFTFLNEQGERWWQASGENQVEELTLLGENAWDVFPDALGSDLYKACHEVLREGTAVEFEAYGELSKLWFWYQVFPFADGLCVHFTDISKHKHLEEELYQTLQEFMDDTLWFNRALVGRLAQVAAKRTGSAASTLQVAELTKREKQVLKRIARGQDNNQIASELGLVEQTVRNYVTHLYSKLGVHSRAEAVVWAGQYFLARNPDSANEASFSSGGTRARHKNPS